MIYCCKEHVELALDVFVDQICKEIRTKEIRKEEVQE